MLKTIGVIFECTVRIVFGLIVCCLIGVPSIGFPSFETLLLRRGIFNDRCQVFNQWSEAGGKPFIDMQAPANAIICAEQRAAYMNIFRSGLLLQAIAWPLVELSMQFVGSVFCSISGSLLLVAGTIIMAEPSSNAAVASLVEPYALGYSLICASGVFLAGAAYYSAIASVKKPFYLGLLLGATVQLSPAVLSFLDKQLDYPSIYVLMRKIIWLAAGILLVTLLNMPFSSSFEEKGDGELLKSLKLWILGSNSKRHSRTSSPESSDVHTDDEFDDDDNDDTDKYPSELTPLLDTAARRVTQILPDSSPVVKKRWRRKPLSKNVFSSTFFILLASYTIHSLSIDSLLVSVQARSQLQSEYSVDQYITEYGPLCAFFATPFILAFSRRAPLTVLYTVTALACTSCAVLQITEAVDSSQFWIALAGSVQSLRGLLFWTNICCMAKLFGFNAFASVLLVLTLASSVLEWFLLYSVDYFFTFDGPGPFKAACIFIGLEIFITLMTLHRFSQVSKTTRRRLLEVEAWIAFSGT